MSFCIKCGLKNVPTTKFCIRCGTLLVRKKDAAPDTPNNSNRNSVAGPESQQGEPERNPVPAANSYFTKDHERFSTPPQELPSVPTGNLSQETDQSSRPTPPNRINSESINREKASLPHDQPDDPAFPPFRPEPVHSAYTSSWMARNKTYLVVGVIAIILFAGFRFYQSRSANSQGGIMADSSGTYGQTSGNDSFDTEQPANNPLPYEPKQQSVVEPQTSTATPEPGSDEWFKDHVARLYQAENQITNTNADLTAVLEFYAFPLDRYYDAKRVDANRLVKIYTDSYSGTLEHHLVRDYENKMTISRKEGGNVKVIAGCNFEFSTKQSPDQIRSRSVYNVYVFNANGKIISVYQLL